MSIAPNWSSHTTNDFGTRPSIWRKISERPYAPEALLLYLALSFFFFGRNLIGHLGDRYVGMCRDPATYMLLFEWWRHALANHLNPFNLTAVWYPNGFNLAWTTSAPLAALAVMPIDATLGPVAAYNVAILVCPALSAWTAFLLCRHIARSYWPALAGGYIFGFSSYMLAHLLGQVDLSMVFLIPVAAYLILQWLAAEITDAKFITLFTLVLVGQFLSTLEILATMTLAIATFLCLFWIWAEKGLRRRILILIPRLAICFAILVPLTSPFLYYFFHDKSFGMANDWAYFTTAAPDQLFVPTSTNILGRLPISILIARGASLWETGEYIGIPLFLLFWNFARTRWKEPIVKALTIFAAIACIATFGPQIRGPQGMILWLPWLLIMQLPLLHMVLTARLSVYLFLDLAIVAAMWLADSTHTHRLRIVAAAIVLASLLPNLSPSFWTMPTTTPPFFKNGTFRRYLSPNETVLVLPYGFSGDSALWLAESKVYFRMAGGYVGISPVVPPSFDQYPAVNSLYEGVNFPDADTQLKAFLVQKRISAVIVVDKIRRSWNPVADRLLPQTEEASSSSQEEQTSQRLLADLHVTPVHVGGVWFYRVPLPELRAYAAIPPQTLHKRMARARFATLIVAANQYLTSGHDPKLLTPIKVQQLGLLPPRWVEGAYKTLAFNEPPVLDALSLGVDSDGNVTVGVLGYRGALEELAKDYSAFAMPPTQTRKDTVRSGNACLFPPALRSANLSEVTKWLLLMRFRPDELKRAAKLAEAELSEQAAHPLGGSRYHHDD